MCHGAYREGLRGITRMVIRGDQQHTTEYRDHFASRPNIPALMILLWLSDLMKVNIGFQDVSIAFLHSNISEEIHVNPPSGLYQGKANIWRLNKAMYGLRGNRKSWQLHFRHIMARFGKRRLQYDPNT